MQRDRFAEQRMVVRGVLFQTRLKRLDRVAAQQALNQVVVHEENILIIVFGHRCFSLQSLSGTYCLITSGTMLTPPLRVERSFRSLYKPTPPVFTRLSVQSSTF